MKHNAENQRRSSEELAFQNPISNFAKEILDLLFLQTIFAVKINKDSTDIYIKLSINIYGQLSLAWQAAVPPPRNYTTNLSILLKSTNEHLAEKPSKSSPNRSQNGAESMKKRPWNDGGAETRF